MGSRSLSANARIGAAPGLAPATILANGDPKGAFAVLAPGAPERDPSALIDRPHRHIHARPVISSER
jgi:hypothetical protein